MTNPSNLPTDIRQRAQLAVLWMESLNRRPSALHAGGGPAFTRQAIQPVQVQLGSQTYAGAKFRIISHVGEGFPTCDGFCLLGDLPDSYKHSSHVCWVFDSSLTDWYVAGFYSQAMAEKNGRPATPAQARYHPHGDYFHLFEWTNDDPIDQYEKYRRIRGNFYEF